MLYKYISNEILKVINKVNANVNSYSSYMHESH